MACKEPNTYENIIHYFPQIIRISVFYWEIKCLCMLIEVAFVIQDIICNSKQEILILHGKFQFSQVST